MGFLRWIFVPGCCKKGTMPRNYYAPQRPSILRRLIKWAFVLGLWGVIIVSCVALWFAKDLPDLIDNPKYERKISITVLANDGTLIARYGDIKEGNISAKRLPKNVTNAIIATEDRRFYYHYGIDPIGIARAAYVNFTQKGLHQGGSTITQQLAKNLFLSQEKTYKRKIQEALLAIWLEHELTKEEILAAYMNRVYLGAGTYGVSAAARVYFDKSPDQLTLQEAAMIAGLLKAPSKYSPTGNPRAARERAKTVLGLMLEAGYINQKQFKMASSSKTLQRSSKEDDQAAKYFSDYVVDTLDDYIATPKTDIVIRTTMDPQVQQTTSATLRKYVEENKAKLKVSEGASVVLRPDGSMLALVGGVNYSESQFNRASQGLRQPGSSFKPIVYLAAIEQGASQDTLVEDAPVSYGRYRPTNFGNKYYGVVRLIDALTLSMNTVSVKLADAIGVDKVINTARRMGITADLVPNLSLALGSSEVPMIEMAGAYATIASGGYAVHPYAITAIEEKDSHKKLYEYKNDPAPQVFRAGDVQMLINMMVSVVQNGTGQGARSPFFVAGKTGTSQDHRDAWFDGFTQDYVAVVWFGNDDNSPMKNVTGGSLASKAWRDIIVAAKADETPSSYQLVKDPRGGGFADMIDGLVSSPFPNLLDGTDGNMGAAQGGQEIYSNSSRFMPDRPGDSVGYSRFND